MLNSLRLEKVTNVLTNVNKDNLLKIVIINVYHHVLKLKINNYINMLFLKLITVLKRHVINYQIKITNIIITTLMKTKYNVLLHVMKTSSTFKKITVLSNVLVIMFMHLIIVI